MGFFIDHQIYPKDHFHIPDMQTSNSNISGTKNDRDRVGLGSGPIVPNMTSWSPLSYLLWLHAIVVITRFGIFTIKLFKRNSCKIVNNNHRKIILYSKESRVYIHLVRGQYTSRFSTGHDNRNTHMFLLIKNMQNVF